MSEGIDYSKTKGHWFYAWLSRYGGGWQDGGLPDYKDGTQPGLQGREGVGGRFQGSKEERVIWCPSGYSRRWALDQANAGVFVQPNTPPTAPPAQAATMFTIEGRPAGGDWRVVDKDVRNRADTDAAIVARYAQNWGFNTPWEYRASPVFQTTTPVDHPAPATPQYPVLRVCRRKDVKRGEIFRYCNGWHHGSVYAVVPDGVETPEWRKAKEAFNAAPGATNPEQGDVGYPVEVLWSPPEPKFDLWAWDGLRWTKQLAGCTRAQADAWKPTYGLKDRDLLPVDSQAPDWRPVRTISFTFGGRNPSPRSACEAMAAQMSVTELKAFITEGANEAERQALRAKELAEQQKRDQAADARLLSFRDNRW